MQCLINSSLTLIFTWGNMHCSLLPSIIWQLDLDIPPTWVIEHAKIQLVWAYKLHPCWRVGVLPEKESYYPKRNHQPYPGIYHLSYNNNWLGKLCTLVQLCINTTGGISQYLKIFNICSTKWITCLTIFLISIYG